MTKRTGKKIKLLKGEKIIYFILIVLIVSAPIINVFTKATLSETNIKVEYLKHQIDKQQNINESLTMQINELASLDRIQEVANALGMSYNDSNVKNISE